MMMIRSIGILSSGKVMGALYAIMGLIVGALFSLVSLVGFAASVASSGDTGAIFSMLFGLGAIILMPLFYGIMGFIGGIIMALIYNVVASMVGGIEIELRPTHGSLPPPVQ